MVTATGIGRGTAVAFGKAGATVLVCDVNEEKGKEKRTAVSYLVQAKNIEGALQNIGEVFSSSVLDYVVANVSETKIMDVFEHDLKKEPDDQPEV